MVSKFLARWNFHSDANYSLQVDWLYFIAFAAVAVGLIIYSGFVILLNLFVLPALQIYNLNIDYYSFTSHIKKENISNIN